MDRLISNKKIHWWMWGTWTILAVLLFGCFPLSPFGEQIPMGDQVIYITISQWMREGLVMYRDMFDHKGLAIYWFNIAGLELGGLTGVWILTVIWAIMTTWGTYKVCRLFSGKNSSFIASLFFILMLTRSSSNDSPEMVAMPFLAIGYYYMLKTLIEKKIPNFFQMFVTALGFGIVLLLKPNLAAGLAFLILIHFIRICKNFESVKFYMFLIGSIIGLLVPLGTALYYILSNGIWTDFVSTFLYFNMEYSSTMTFAQRMIAFVKLVFYYPPSLIMWIFSVFIVPVMIKSGEWNKLWPVLVAHVALLIFSVNMSGYASGLYILPLLPLYAIYIARFFDWAKGTLRYGGFIILAIYLSYIGFRSVLEYMNCDPWWPKDTISKSLITYIEKNTDKEDTFTFYPCGPMFPYYATGRHSPSKYLYHSPIFDVRPSMRDEYFDDLRKNKPLLIFVFKDHDDRLPDDLMKMYKKTDSPIESAFVYRLI